MDKRCKHCGNNLSKTPHRKTGHYRCEVCGLYTTPEAVHLWGDKEPKRMGKSKHTCPACGAVGTTGKRGTSRCTKCNEWPRDHTGSSVSDWGCGAVFCGGFMILGVVGIVGSLYFIIADQVGEPGEPSSFTGNPMIYGPLGIPLLMMIVLLLMKKK